MIIITITVVIIQRTAENLGSRPRPLADIKVRASCRHRQHRIDLNCTESR